MLVQYQPTKESKMGSSHSKRSNKFRKDDKNNEVKILHDNKTGNSESEVSDEALLDKQYTEDIKKDLCENPEMFVLNNLLMAIMFFKNYPRDVMEIAKKGNDLTDTCYYPDDIIEKVNENVLYRAKHGENKFISEPLIPKRVFIVNRSVKVLGPMEEIERLETHLVRTEESQKKGFVRLKEIVPTFSPDGSPILSVEGESTTSSSRTSSNGDYATFEEMRKSIHDVFATINTQEILPKTCIEHRRCRKLDLPQDINVEDITEEDLYQVHSYISSRGFMQHFHENLFPSLGRDTLHLAEEQILTGRPRVGKIKCKYRDEEFSQTWDIIPAVPIKWPGEQTLEFIMKSQRSPGPRTHFLFPNPTMVGEIMHLGALLIPRSCYSKDRHRKDRNIEWEICFPQAEKYLEKFMTHSQMKSYVILLCLYKTYISPITFEKGLLIEHLQSFFLAQLDKNFMEWPEHKLGTKLFKLLKELNFLIGSSDLKDYFISQKKPLDHIAKKYLRENQRVLHDVIESPLMGFLKALRNLQYVKGGQSFYTPIDFDKLYSILQQKGIQLTIPNLAVVSPPRRKISSENLDSSTIWVHVNENVKREKKRRQKELEKQRELEEALARRQSEDSIDLTWTCEKKFDLHKKRALLKFFIEIFLEISNKCAKYLWYKQGLLYLKQTKYLTEILKQECAAFGDDVLEIMEKIKQEELQIAELSKRTHQDVTEENIKTRIPNGPLVNGNIPSVEKRVKVKPHVEIEKKKLNNVKDVDILSPKTTKNRRKTVAFNFANVTTN